MKPLQATAVLAATLTLATAAQASELTRMPSQHSDTAGERQQMLSYNQPDHQKMMAMMQQMMEQMQAKAVKASPSNVEQSTPYAPWNDRERERH